MEHLEAKIICLHTAGHHINNICWLLDTDRATVHMVLFEHIREQEILRDARYNRSHLNAYQAIEIFQPQP